MNLAELKAMQAAVHDAREELGLPPVAFPEDETTPLTARLRANWEACPYCGVDDGSSVEKTNIKVSSWKTAGYGWKRCCVLPFTCRICEKEWEEVHVFAEAVGEEPQGEQDEDQAG